MAMVQRGPADPSNDDGRFPGKHLEVSGTAIYTYTYTYNYYKHNYGSYMKATQSSAYFSFGRNINFNISKNSTFE